MPPFEPESIVHAVIFLIVLFIASVFWVSYYRVRSPKLLLAAVGFSLLVLSAIVHHALGLGGPRLAFLELIAFLLFAMSFLKRKEREEDEGEQDATGEQEDEGGTGTREMNRQNDEPPEPEDATPGRKEMEEPGSEPELGPERNMDS